MAKKKVPKWQTVQKNLLAFLKDDPFSAPTVIHLVGRFVERLNPEAGKALQHAAVVLSIDPSFNRANDLRVLDAGEDTNSVIAAFAAVSSEARAKVADVEA